MVKCLDKVSYLAWLVLWRMTWVGTLVTCIVCMSMWLSMKGLNVQCSPTFFAFAMDPTVYIYPALYTKYAFLGMKAISYLSWSALTFFLVCCAIYRPYTMYNQRIHGTLVLSQPYGHAKFWWRWIWRLELFTTPLVLSDFFYMQRSKPCWLLLGENILTFIIAYFILRSLLVKHTKNYGLSVKWVTTDI